MDFVQYLPPVLANSAALLPFLIKESPISFPEKLKKLALAMYTIIIWVGYFITLVIGRQLFYLESLTILLLIISFVFFLLVLRNIVRDDSPISKASLYYMLALLFVSMGFTNYSAPSNQVIILLPRSGVQEVYVEDQSGVRINLNYRRGWLETGIILDKNRFENIRSIAINTSENGERVYFRDQLIQANQRGFGELYDFSN